MPVFLSVRGTDTPLIFSSASIAALPSGEY